MRVLCLSVGVVAALILGHSVAADECSVVVQPGASIQAAVDAACAGAVICLAVGEWEEHVVIGKSLTLRGTQDRTILRGSVRDVPVVRVHTAEQGEVAVVLDGLTVTGGRGWDGPGLLIEDAAQVTAMRASSAINGDVGIRLMHTAGITVVDSAIRDNRREGLSLSDNARATVTGSDIEGNGYGIIVHDTAQFTIADSTVRGNWEEGVSLSDSAEGQVVRTLISGNGGDGLSLRNVTQASVTDSTIEDNRHGGITLWDSALIIIEHSTIGRNGEVGIALWDSAQATISGSAIRENGWDGVVPWDASQATVTVSTVTENGWDGIVVGPSATILLDRSAITGNERYGFALYEHPCFDTDWVFTGLVQGFGNAIPGPDEKDGNSRGSVCSDDLAFLMTDEGGALDRRR